MPLNTAFREFFGLSKETTEENMETQHVENTERREEKKIVGKIIKVSDEGWGFVIAQEIPFTRIFFHWTSLVHDTKKFPELKRGMHVEFVPVDKGERGYHAIKVKVVEDAAAN
jgi:hypothetical protein